MRQRKSFLAKVKIIPKMQLVLLPACLPAGNIVYRCLMLQLSLLAQ